jgi:hypothetical protein
MAPAAASSAAMNSAAARAMSMAARFSSSLVTLPSMAEFERCCANRSCTTKPGAGGLCCTDSIVPIADNASRAEGNPVRLSEPCSLLSMPAFIVLARIRLSNKKGNYTVFFFEEFVSLKKKSKLIFEAMVVPCIFYTVYLLTAKQST